MNDLSQKTNPATQMLHYGEHSSPDVPRLGRQIREPVTVCKHNILSYSFKVVLAPGNQHGIKYWVLSAYALRTQLLIIFYRNDNQPFTHLPLYLQSIHIVCFHPFNKWPLTERVAAR